MLAAICVFGLFLLTRPNAPRDLTRSRRTKTPTQEDGVLREKKKKKKKKKVFHTTILILDPSVSHLNWAALQMTIPSVICSAKLNQALIRDDSGLCVVLEKPLPLFRGTTKSSPDVPPPLPRNTDEGGVTR